jgi:hypothetical protein
VGGRKVDRGATDDPLRLGTRLNERSRFVEDGRGRVGRIERTDDDRSFDDVR